MEGKGLKERVNKLVKFLNSLVSDDGVSKYVSAGDVAMYLEGGFGQEEPENEIQIGTEEN